MHLARWSQMKYPRSTCGNLWQPANIICLPGLWKTTTILRRSCLSVRNRSARGYTGPIHLSVRIIRDTQAADHSSDPQKSTARCPKHQKRRSCSKWLYRPTRMTSLLACVENIVWLSWLYWLLLPPVPFLCLRAAALCGQAGEGVKYQMDLSTDEVGYKDQVEVGYLFFRWNGPFVVFVESITVRAGIWGWGQEHLKHRRWWS